MRNGFRSVNSKRSPSSRTFSTSSSGVTHWTAKQARASDKLETNIKQWKMRPSHHAVGLFVDGEDVVARCALHHNVHHTVISHGSGENL